LTENRQEEDVDAPGADLTPGDLGELEDAPGVDPAVIPQAVGMRMTFSGPLPPPDLLAGYNAALPDGADRIVRLAEEQAAHRRRLEARGQVLLFSFAVLALVGGIVLIALGKSAEGLIPLISAIAGLGGLFAYREYVTRRITNEVEPTD
jgi:hypothetical protein